MKFEVPCRYNLPSIPIFL